MDRRYFSCGSIDGQLGTTTRRTIKSFQIRRGLPVTGELDPATRQALTLNSPAIISYIVDENDFAEIAPVPKSWVDKSQVALLGYNDAWEALGEKFHADPDLLKRLNPGVTSVDLGTVLQVPDPTPVLPLPTAASFRVTLSETMLEALDANGQIIVHFPCSIAKDKNKRPNGQLHVIVIAPHPNYTYDPALFSEDSAREGITKKLIIPPGPNNPVGVAWIGLSLPGYGIHGTPEPEYVGRTQSHGCFRLANWNAERMLKLVKRGMVVDVAP